MKVYYTSGFILTQTSYVPVVFTGSTVLRSVITAMEIVNPNVVQSDILS